MTSEDEIRAASKKFYAALNGVFNGDATGMNDIWLHSATVTAMRPNGGREVGWEELWAVWQRMAEIFEGGHIELSDQLIRVDGDFAYEVGLEHGQFSPGGTRMNTEHRVTNIYRRVGDDWKIIHHHTDISADFADALSRLGE